MHLALEASRVAAMRDQTLDVAWKVLLAVMCMKTQSISDSEIVVLLKRIIDTYPYYPHTYRLLLEMHRAGRTGDALSEATAEELRLRMPAIAPYQVEYLSFGV
jgi:predicted Zn-dependent protease